MVVYLQRLRNRFAVGFMGRRGVDFGIGLIQLFSPSRTIEMLRSQLWWMKLVLPGVGGLSLKILGVRAASIDGVLDLASSGGFPKVPDLIL